MIQIFKTSRSAYQGTDGGTNPARLGFTLIELMVSVALALILILGVNQVFKITSETISATESLESAVRESRAAQATFAKDFRGAVSDQPVFIIDAITKYAYRNADDENSDIDGQLGTYDPGRVGSESLVNAYDYGNRSHRIDIMNFFAADLFTRQTGNDGVYASATTSSEAWIWYGPLRIQNGNVGSGQFATTGGSSGNGAYPFPGDAPKSANPNNFYASQWALGRVQILLSETPVGEAFIQRTASGTVPDDRLDPLVAGATASSNGTTTSASNSDGTAWTMQHHRFDLAGTSIQQMKTAAKTRQDLYQVTPNAPYAGWCNIMSYRFAANPIVTRPANASRMAQAAPVMIGSCSQFIVEYAGDYLTQTIDPMTGALTTTPGSDGVIDFIPQQISGVVYSKATRWYGMPRDTGSAIGGGFKGRPDGGIDVAYDVVPLRDVVAEIRPIVPLPQATFEKVLPSPGPSGGSYGPVTSQNGTTMQEYLCGWGPFESGHGLLPKMIRLTVTIDDAAGRLSSGQTFEYIYKLGL